MKLNDADAIYIGGAQADAVYAGATKVWPPEIVDPPTEYEPVFTVTSSYYGSPHGASGDGAGMRDGDHSSGGLTMWASNGDSFDNIAADLGADVAVGDVGVACIGGGYDGWNEAYLNGAILQTASAAAPTTWTTVATISNPAVGEYPYAVNATCRYVRLYASSAWLNVGDFRIYPPGGRRGV